MVNFCSLFLLTKQPGFLLKKKTGLVYIQIYAFKSGVSSSES